MTPQAVHEKPRLIKQHEPKHSAKIDSNDLDFLFSLALQCDRGIREIKGLRGPSSDLHLTGLRMTAHGEAHLTQTPYETSITLKSGPAEHVNRLISADYLTLGDNAHLHITKRGENVMLRIIAEVRGKKRYGNFIKHLQHEYEQHQQAGNLGNNDAHNDNLPKDVLTYLKSKLFTSAYRKKFAEILAKSEHH